MRKRQAAVAAVAAIILGVTGCSGNTRTAATTAQATAAQETTVSGETTAAQETTAAESETDSQDSVQAGTAVNPEIYTGLTEEEVSQIEASMEEILAFSPDGVMLSNGPGDPQACVKSIEELKRLYNHGLPIFGICLGHHMQNHRIVCFIMVVTVTVPV